MNFTPTSIALLSVSAATAGVASSANNVSITLTASVVKDHTAGSSPGFPAVSLASTVAVYWVETERGALGMKVTVLVALS
jgi:hypothetical protein